ncbi:MAG: anti-sigma-factor antagonist [Bacteroidetes bacterium]|jgi:anti-sigma B factor antagonist|nr:anti-sigma-factor antagonist [Bacteroidota bacterium]
MSIKTSTLEAGIGLIDVSGSLIGGEETDKMRAAVAGFVDRQYERLIIDLSNVTYLNSTAIGVLVSAHTTYTRRNWQIKLCGISKNIQNIFVITKLTLVFDVQETREEAVKSFV